MKEYKDYAKITAHFDLAIEEAIKFGGDVGKHAVLLFETMRNELDTVPAADVVEVRHGRWEWNENAMDWGLGGWVCSECRAKNDNIPAKPDIHPSAWVGSHYCPNCGCKMDKGG